MGKLIVEVQTSIDGFVAGKDGQTDWMIWHWQDDWTWDPALQQYHNQITDWADKILLSRKMGEEGDFIQHWERMAEMPDNPQVGFARKIIATPKIVFSKKLKEPPTAKSTLAQGRSASAIKKLKSQPQGNLIAYGGASFVTSLLKDDLVDELHMVVNPVILGKGMSIFSKVTEKRLILESAQGFDSGISLLKYRRG